MVWAAAFRFCGPIPEEYERMGLVTLPSRVTRGWRMRTVVVRVDDAGLSGQMAAMREWLDHHRCEPARFVCEQTGDALVVSIAFLNEAGAEAFATHFDGQEPAEQTTYSPASPSPQLGDPPLADNGSAA
jgi:hypothetical protein